MIGIENRFGYNMFQGDIDHSGLPYTSLMPRSVASLYLKFNRRAHNRTTLNPQRKYRTYTYTQRGYQKLLAQSGFQSNTFYWSDPGYNQPYSLVPMRSTLVRQYFRWKRADPSQAFRSDWRWRAKGALVWILPLVAPDFVIVAEKSTGASQGQQNRLMRAMGETVPLLGPQAPLSTLYTYSFGIKSLIRVFEPTGDAPSVVFKVSTVAQGSREAIQLEFQNLSLVAQRLGMQAGANFAVPAPLGFYQVGSLSVAAESVATGQQLSTILVGERQYRQPNALRRELSHCVSVAVQLAKMLRSELAIKKLDVGSLALPAELQSEPEIWRLLNGESGPSIDKNWVQHGDFTIENIFLDRTSGRLTVIDWEHLIRGLPPLSDVFNLLISALPLVSPQLSNSGRGQGRIEPKFHEAFFGRSPWAELFHDLILVGCSELSIPTSQLWETFVQFLILRIHHVVPRSSEAMTTQSNFLLYALRHREQFLFPPNP